jgi:hypothetical protein
VEVGTEYRTCCEPQTKRQFRIVVARKCLGELRQRNGRPLLLVASQLHPATDTLYQGSTDRPQLLRTRVRLVLQASRVQGKKLSICLNV